MKCLALIFPLVASVLFIFGCQKSDRQSTNRPAASFLLDTVQQYKSDTEKLLNGFWGIEFGTDISEAIKIVRSKSKKGNITIDTSDMPTFHYASISITNVSFGGKNMAQWAHLSFFNNKFYSGWVNFSKPDYEPTVKNLLYSTSLFDSLKVDLDEKYFITNKFKSLDRRDFNAETTLLGILLGIKEKRIKIYAKWSFPSQRREIMLTVNPDIMVDLEYKDFVLSDSADYFYGLFLKQKAENRPRTKDL